MMIGEGTRPTAEGANDRLQPPSSVSRPPRGGNVASDKVRTAAFWPTSLARSIPLQWSPMITTARLMRPAPPTPWSSRSTRSTWKEGDSADRSPNSPKDARQRTEARRVGHESVSTCRSRCCPEEQIEQQNDLAEKTHNNI